jgi:heterodisulfide reductase subunit A
MKKSNAPQDFSKQGYMCSTKSILIIGGGIAGIQTALDLADMGFQVYLVERSSSIGGRMAQLDKTFPTNDCSMCILSPKMIGCARHENITLLVYSEVVGIKGDPGNFTVRIRQKPKYVDHIKCTGCGDCISKCPAQVPNEFNMSLDTRKAIWLRFPQAVPRKVVIDSDNCLFLTKGRCRVCEKVCQAGAIDFDQKEKIIELNAVAIVFAIGFEPYDVSSLKEYGYNEVENVIIAMEYERLISASGPTGGELVRRSDKKVPSKLAFIQCVGSRDIRNKLYCSSVCCMYATKEAILAKEHYQDIETIIFYTDLRAGGKNFQSYISRARDEYGVLYIRGRPGQIERSDDTGNPIIIYEDTTTRLLKQIEVDMVVLCPALVPSKANNIERKLGIELDAYGFIKIPDRVFFPFDTSRDGIYACGFCQNPQDIPNSVVQASGVAARVAEIVCSASV